MGTIPTCRPVGRYILFVGVTLATAACTPHRASLRPDWVTNGCPRSTLGLTVVPRVTTDTAVVRGRIVNEKGAPVRGNVLVQGTALSTFADTTGVFRVAFRVDTSARAVPSGIVVRQLQYLTVSRTLSIAPGDSIDLDVHLCGYRKNWVED